MSTHSNSVMAANRSSAYLALRILNTTQSYGNKVSSSESIAEVYEQGTNVAITSDGVVYNGESASTFWQVEYLLTITRLDGHRRQRSLGLSHSNLKIIETKELRYFRALRIFDLLGFSETEHLESRRASHPH